MPSNFIPLSEPYLCGREWDYVKDCLDSGWVSSAGSYVDRFEQSVATAAGKKFGTATTNGTSALHIALMLAGVRSDDEVLVPTLTFIAPANAVRYIGAHPIFVDAESRYWQMDDSLVEDFLLKKCERSNGVLRNRQTGRRVAALLPVHALGHPANPEVFVKLGERFDIPVIEDATESLGSTWNNRPSGWHGLLSCFSFNGNKILTTGGGGMIVTNDEALAKRAKYLTTQAKDDPVEYVHGEVGYNYRLTNLQAAMGCAQMEKLQEFVARKRRIAKRYCEAFVDLAGVIPMAEAPQAESNCWMFTILLEEGRSRMGSRELLKALGNQGVQSRPLWQPLHLSPAYVSAPVLGGEVSERLYRNALSLPCSAGLAEGEQERVISLTREFLSSC